MPPRNGQARQALLLTGRGQATVSLHQVLALCFCLVELRSIVLPLFFVICAVLHLLHLWLFNTSDCFSRLVQASMRGRWEPDRLADFAIAWCRRSPGQPWQIESSSPVKISDQVYMQTVAQTHKLSQFRSRPTDAQAYWCLAQC